VTSLLGAGVLQIQHPGKRSLPQLIELAYWPIWVPCCIVADTISRLRGGIR
jgi:hypothetical protein